MTDETPTLKSVKELVETFNTLAAQADEIRRRMDELTLQINAHKEKVGNSSHEIDTVRDQPS
jgi:uncharacterized coiled-coil DUF342 family protein